MLNEKEKIIYETIYNFIDNYGYSPTIRELCNLLDYKSTKTVHSYLKKLKNKNYITFQPNKKRAIKINVTSNRKIIEFNSNKQFSFDINKNHIIFQLKNNYFIEYNIKKNDYLIININKRIKNNDLGLFLINNDYRIMKYNYFDGYYILEDNTKEILNKIDLIGVVERIYRNKI